MTRAHVYTLLCSVTIAMLMFTVVPRASTQNVLGECGLTFDDAAALAAIPDQAAATFASKYRMPCSPHFLNVEPLTIGHFHLSFEDPTIDCYTAESNGIYGAGKLNGSDCVAVDWDHEPRILQSHVQAHWIKIWMEDASSHQTRPFDLRRVSIGSGPSIQLWYRTQDGSWWFWNELKGAKNWKVEQWSKNVMEVRIRGSNSGPGAYTIRNAYIHD